MKYAYTNGVLLDGSADMQPQRGMVLRTDGEKILDIVPEGTDLTGFEIVDLKGGYLMPGLINLHVHLPASGSPKKQGNPRKLVKFMTSMALTRRIALAMCEGYAKTQLLSGVTTIRTVGGIADIDTRLRGRIAAGKCDGPRILAADMAVSVPGGHMAGSLAYEATSAAQAAEDVRKIAQGKPDLIKLMITGGVLDAKKKGEPGELKMPPEYVRAACGEAHRLGLPVAAHVESTEGVRVALAAGVDTIEHGAEMDDEIRELYKGAAGTQLAGRPASVTCTISPALPFVLLAPEKTHSTEVQKVNGDIVCNGIINSAREALEAGIPVGLGTDSSCPYVTQYDMWREVAYFAKYAGVSNAFALHTATQVNAGLLGLGNVTGTVEVGKDADLLVVAGDPLVDLSALRAPLHVMARGKLADKLKVKHIAELDRELDWILDQPVER